MHTQDNSVQTRHYLKCEHASRCTARAAQGVWGGVVTARSSRGALHTVGQSRRAHGGRDEFTGAERRGLRSRCRYGVCRCSLADASVGGVRQRPLPTCVSLLQGAWAASLHPAQGTGLLLLQVPTVLSGVAGARTRRAARPSARVHRSAPVDAWGLFVPVVEAASDLARRASQGRAVWPARSSAA